MAEKESQLNRYDEPDAIWESVKKLRRGGGRTGKTVFQEIAEEGGDPISGLIKRLRKGEVNEGEGAFEWLRGRPTKGFSFLVNGTIGGALGLALTGALIGSVELGEIWKEYGKNHFPLDPFTKRGRATMRAEFRKMKDAFKRIG